MYAFGRGTFGATGLGSKDNVCQPRCISALEGKQVVQLAAGRQHTVALTAAGQLYTWGDGQLGQLGLGCSCSSSRSDEQDQEMQDAHQSQHQEQHQQRLEQQQANDGGSNWLLPSGQLSPRLLTPQQLPWQAGCPVLFIAAGGDHNLAVVQLPGSTSCHVPSGTPGMDMIVEELAGNLPPAAGQSGSLQAAEAARQASNAVMADSLQHQQANGTVAMEVDAPAAALPQQQASLLLPPAAAPSGPDPLHRPYGLSLAPVQPPPLLQLAAAAAAEAAAARRAAGMLSPEPGSAGHAAAAAAATGVGPEAVRSAAAAARDDNARAASTEARPSPVVVDLAHAVLDVFSSPGLLLLLFKADSKGTQQQLLAADPAQQQQQHSPSKQPPQQDLHHKEQQQQQQAAVAAHGLDLDRIESTYTLLLKSYAREVVSALGAACVRLLQELPDSTAWASGSSSSSSEVVRLLFILLQNPLNSDVHGLGSVLLGLLTALVLRLNGGSLRLLLGWLGQLKPEVFGARVVRPVQALLTRLSR